MKTFEQWLRPTCPRCGGPMKGRGNCRCYRCSPPGPGTPGARRGDAPGHYPPRAARLAAERAASDAVVAALAPLGGIGRRRVLAALLRRATVGDLRGGGS